MTDAGEKQNPKHKKQNVTLHKELTFSKHFQMRFPNLINLIKRKSYTIHKTALL